VKGGRGDKGQMFEVRGVPGLLGEVSGQSAVRVPRFFWFK